MGNKLSVNNHRADVLGLNYVYPVLSRRAGGLSIGINFNTNNTCNWRCVYCQVPNLVKGAAPALDFGLLAQELRGFLQDVLHGDFYGRFDVDPDKRVIKDIAIAGNGEPTSLKEFPQAIRLIGEIATALGVFPASDYVLITNGSLIHLPKVQEGLKILAEFGGQVWFKFDSATETGRQRLNNASQSCAAAVANLKLACSLCETKLQTCLFDFSGQGLLDSERQAYLKVLRELQGQCSLRRVMLYTIARPSAQPEAPQLAKLPSETLAALAEDIRALGYEVSVTL